MNFVSTAGALLLLLFTESVYAEKNHPQLTGPMPPDPVTVNRAGGPLTPASLAVWQMTSSASDFLWRMLGATETLSTPQLRTLCLDLLRVRRFYDHDSPQDWLMISAWMDREPTAAVRELLNIPDWEDRDDNIGDYDSDVEFMGSLFWKKLAEQDFPAALTLARNLEGRESIGQFFEYLESSPGSIRFTPEQAAALVKISATLTSQNSAAGLAVSFVHELANTSSPEAARTFIRLLPDGVIRDKCAAALRKLESGPNQPAPQVASPPTMPDGPLRRLQEMDCRVMDEPFPFPLFRAIRTLSPEDSRLLVAQMPEENANAGWLRWLLVKQAEEAGQTADSFPRAVLPSSHWFSPGLGLETPDAAEKRAAIAKAAGGKYQAALEEAAQFRMSPASANQLSDPPHEVLLIWALRDFPAAMDHVVREKDGQRRDTYIGALDKAMHRLPCAVVLPHLPPSLWGELYIDPWRIFIPFEDREAGFRYFEKHHAILPGEASDFLATAVRFEPVRAVGLAREIPSALSRTAGGLATHWPDRIGGLLKPEDSSDVWEAVGRSLARHHPEKVIAVLKTQPHLQAWEVAVSELSLQPAIRPELILELKSNMPEQAADSPAEEVPDPFREGR